MADVFANNATLTTTSTSGTTAPVSGTIETWSVGALSASWPALTTGQTMSLQDRAIQGEIIRITASTGSPATSITVTRGADGTTPVAHAIGATFICVAVASALNAFGTGNCPVPAGAPDLGDAVVVTQASPLELGYEAIVSFTAPGQLPVGVSSGVGELLGVGTNGQVLTVGGSDPSGLEWATPGAPPAVAVLPLQQPVSGNQNIIFLPYYNGAGTGVPDAYPANGLCYYYPLIINDPCEITGLAAFVNDAGGTGSLNRFGVMNDSSGLPGTVLHDAGAVSSSGYNMVGVSGLTISLTSGRYWIAVVTQGAPSPVPGFTALGSGCVLPTVPWTGTLGIPINIQNIMVIGFSQTGVTGALGTASGLSPISVGGDGFFPLVAVSFA